MTSELRRVLAILAGIAALVLGLLALVNHTDPDVVYWLAGAVIAAGTGVILEVI